MTLLYLLDTDVVSEPLRPTPDRVVVKKLRQYADDLAISAVTWHELWFGCRRLAPSRKREAIEAYLTDVIGAAVSILPYDAQAAAWHAAERARLTQAGQTPAFADGQIAAIAHANDLTLVTFNGSDYAHFQDLQVVDWRR